MPRRSSKIAAGLAALTMIGAGGALALNASAGERHFLLITTECCPVWGMDATLVSTDPANYGEVYYTWHYQGSARKKHFEWTWEGQPNVRVQFKTNAYPALDQDDHTFDISAAHDFCVKLNALAIPTSEGDETTGCTPD